MVPLSGKEDFDLDLLIKKYTLHNALKYEGTANPKAVLGKVLAEKPGLRANVKELYKKVDIIVKEVNSLSVESQKTDLMDIAPELLEEQKGKIVEKTLPPLKNAEDKVIMRFAPGPSGPLHIGHARAAILNDEYCKKYQGKLILRLEDTNPAKVNFEAYDMIKEDLNWLEVVCHETVIQSERFDKYYQLAEELLASGHAYICTCDVEHWRKLKIDGSACPDREKPVEEQLESWKKMLDGTYPEGSASYVVKTDLNHPNPAVRDFVGFRIIDKPYHPRTEDNYRVYPLMNFTVAVDDHLLGLTHVLRGKDHLNNTYRQGYLYDYFSWEKPEYIHYGWVSIENTILKTSEITRKIADGEIKNWTDVRLGTFRSLAARGILPGAIRKYWIDVGLKEVDVKFSWETLYAFNRELVDSVAPRYFFVPDPVNLGLEGISELEGHAPFHPEYPDRGIRKVKLSPGESGQIEIMIAGSDWETIKEGELFRLKDLCNVKSTSEGKLDFEGNDLSVLKSGHTKIVQWVSGSKHVSGELLMPDGERISGTGEELLQNATGELVQLERIGFVKVYPASEPRFSRTDSKQDEKLDIIAVFCHK